MANKNTLFPISVLALTALLVAAPDRSLPGREVSARLTEKIVEAVRQYKHAAVKISGTYETRMSSYDGDRRFAQDVHRCEVKQKGESRSLQVSEQQLAELTGAKKTSDSVFVANDRYNFAAERKAGGSEWKLKRLGEGSGDLAEGLTQPLKLEVNFIVLLPVCLLATPLDVILTDARVKITKLVEASDGVSLAFELPHPAPKEIGPDVNGCPVQSGTLTLDPRHYVIRRGTLQCKYPNRTSEIDLAFEYKSSDKPIPLPVSGRVNEVSHYQGLPRPRRMEQEMTFNLTIKVDHREEEFSLTHFGLPEPEILAPPPQRPPYHWYIVAAAIAVAILAFFLRRMNVRRSQAIA